MASKITDFFRMAIIALTMAIIVAFASQTIISETKPVIVISHGCTTDTDCETWGEMMDQLSDLGYRVYSEDTQSFWERTENDPRFK